MQNKVLIFPSWYATIEAPTSGSFFREQSLLMAESENPWNVKVLTTEKIWISRQRFLFNQLFPSKNNAWIEPQPIAPPTGAVIHYPFCKYVSDELNLNTEVHTVISFLEKHPEMVPDLIHAHSTLKGGIIAAYTAKHFRVPYIITEHLTFLLHQYTDFWKQEIIQALEGADQVLAVSEHQRQQLLMHGINCNPISVGNLVDDERFTIVPKEKSDRLHFLIVTFYPNFIKDMETFFAALMLLKDQGTLNGKLFTIVGGGERSGEYGRNYYETKTKELGLEGFIQIIPKANRDEMARLMQETDALISTSIAETFGVAICEAMLCGKPVITTLNGGVNDYRSKENAITIPVRSPEKLAAAINDFKSKQNSFDGQLIRQQIQHKYGKEAFRKRIDEIYKRVLKSK